MGAEEGSEQKRFYFLVLSVQQSLIYGFAITDICFNTESSFACIVCLSLSRIGFKP